MPMVMDLVYGGGGTGLNFRHDRPGQLITEIHKSVGTGAGGSGRLQRADRGRRQGTPGGAAAGEAARTQRRRVRSRLGRALSGKHRSPSPCGAVRRRAASYRRGWRRRLRHPAQSYHRGARRRLAHGGRADHIARSGSTSTRRHEGRPVEVSSSNDPSACSPRQRERALRYRPGITADARTVGRTVMAWAGDPSATSLWAALKSCDGPLALACPWLHRRC